MTESSAEPCDHHDEQVAVRMLPLEEADEPCSWCGDDAVLGLVKSERHELALCGDCRDVIKVLAK